VTPTLLYDFAISQAIRQRIDQPQAPKPVRGDCRLMVYRKAAGTVEHRQFADILEYLKGKEIWVNESKLLRRRLRLTDRWGAMTWATFLVQQAPRKWQVEFHHDASPKVEDIFQADDGTGVLVIDRNAGYYVVVLNQEPDWEGIGTVPFDVRTIRPPDERDVAAYECVWARVPGCLTVPTAGIPFTEAISAQLDVRKLVLHLGHNAYGLLNAQNIENCELPGEEYAIGVPPSKPVIAIGTTVTRALETYALTGQRRGYTELFIREGHQFRLTEGLLTNFHLPLESLTVLAAAFAGGREKLLPLYEQAVELGYDFSDYGDSMLILP